MEKENRPKIKRSKKASTRYVNIDAYSGSFKSPMSWSVGGGW
jgi:hypothetical protein